MLCFSTLAVVALHAVLCVSAPAPARLAKRSEPAPLLTPRTHVDNLIAGKYIVKFVEGSELASLEDHFGILNVAPQHVFRNTFQGFAAQLTEAALEALQDHPDVEYIEQDATIKTYGFVQQTLPPWGLARISIHNRKNGAPYTYDASAGDGTCSYVIDTGIDVTHPDFQGRAEMAANFLDNNNQDDDGHGTHTAGIIGSATYGVAKKTKLYGIKVINKAGNGTLSSFVKGMDFVSEDAAKRKCPKGVVANMSVGGPFSQAINDAAAKMIKNKIFLGVAAGNSDTDAKDFSPASEPTVCTVGAASPWDGRWMFSNYGNVVDIFAPGQNILSTLPGGGVGEKSGTSMASPFVVGLAAYYAGLEGFDDPQALCKKLAAQATPGKLGGIPEGTPNLLAFNGNPSP